jgi:thiamine biosynthesis lipoprotein
MVNRSRFVFYALLCFLSACSRPGTYQKTETIMGTEVTVTVVAPSERTGAAAIDAAMAELRRLDEMMSLYKDASELSRVNLAAGLRPVKVSPEMLEAVEAAARISELTDGAFDVTMGPLVVLWQMRLREKKTPTEGELALARSRVGYRNIVIDRAASTLFLKKPGMIMDLGGVAKGYAADKAAAVLGKRGIRNGIVAIAGDIRAMGTRPGGLPWRIGVQHPREPGKTLAVLELADKSVSTSGDYERFQIVNRKRYHHIIDPRTGRPSESLISVTVTGGSGALVDPLTTALFIVGVEKGMAFASALGCEAIFEDAEGRIATTSGIRINK